MKQRLLPLLALLVLQVVAFGQADSCFTLLIRPTLLGAPYYDIFPITVTNQTQGNTFTMSDSLLHNCDLTGVEDFEARGFSLSAVYPNPSEGKAEVKLTTPPHIAGHIERAERARQNREPCHLGTFRCREGQQLRWYCTGHPGNEDTTECQCGGQNQDSEHNVA